MKIYVTILLALLNIKKLEILRTGFITLLLFSGDSLGLVIQNGCTPMKVLINTFFFLIVFSFVPINIYMVKDSKLKSNILLLEKKKENLNCDNCWKTGETIGRAEVRKVVKRNKDNLLKWQRAGREKGTVHPPPACLHAILLLAEHHDVTWCWIFLWPVGVNDVLATIPNHSTVGAAEKVNSILSRDSTGF